MKNFIAFAITAASLIACSKTESAATVAAASSSSSGALAGKTYCVSNGQSAERCLSFKNGGTGTETGSGAATAFSYSVSGSKVTVVVSSDPLTANVRKFTILGESTLQLIQNGNATSWVLKTAPTSDFLANETYCLADDDDACLSFFEDAKGHASDGSGGGDDFTYSIAGNKLTIVVAIDPLDASVGTFTITSDHSKISKKSGNELLVWLRQ